MHTNPIQHRRPQRLRLTITRTRLLLSAAIYLLFSPLAFVQAQSFVDLALGGSNICAIDSNGSLECTTGPGQFSRDVFLPPDDNTLYSAVSSGAGHTCAITQDEGDIRCWGFSNFGQLDAPSIEGGFVSLSASGNHTCAIDTNTQAHCWGFNNAGQTTVPEPNNGFVSIHTGSGSSCGVKDSGELVCWTTNSMITDNLPENPGYTDLVLGEGGFDTIQSCGLTQDGLIDCFATNASSSLEVPDTGPYIQIETAVLWLCGLGADGVLDCSFETRNTANSSFTNTRNAAFLEEIATLPLLSSFDMTTRSSTIVSICGLTLDGNLECIGDSLPANTTPGDSSNLLIDIPVPVNLSSAVYSDTTVELFWETSRNFIAGRANIYRDGELLTSTTNRTSFIDDTLEADQDYVYMISLVEPSGNEGPLSAPILVSTSDRGQISGDGGDGGNANNSTSHPGQPTNINLTRHGDTTLEIFWDRVGANPRYLIYRNGEFLAFTAGPSYFDDDVNADTAYHYTIVVRERMGEDVIGVGFINEPAL